MASYPKTNRGTTFIKRAQAEFTFARKAIMGNSQPFLSRLEKYQQLAQSFLHRPQSLLFHLDQTPKWFSKAVLSFASGVFDPHLIAKGVVVEEWSSTSVGVKIPERWINRLGSESESSNISNIFSLVQLCLKLFWEWQSGVDTQPIEMSRLQWQSLQPGQGALKARYHIEASRRDALLFELQKEGTVDVDIEIHILDARDLLIGTVSGSVTLRGPKYLPR